MTPRPLIGLCALLSASSANAFDRNAWERDYANLKIALAESYANLDWQVERRTLNLQRADQFIAGMLAQADNDTAATLAIVKLVDAFHDPHLELHAGAPPENTPLVPSASDVGGPASMTDQCADEGYRTGNAATRLPYVQAPGWQLVSEGPFLAGMIGDIGIIRIPSFVEQDYGAACTQAVRPGMDGRALQLATRAKLNQELRDLTKRLRSKGMKRLAIDVSRNGGGSEWSSEAITIFASGTLRRAMPRIVGKHCDRSVMWKGEKAPCSVYGGQAEIETVAALPGENVWDGPLAILADRRTASAAEEFVTWARDNDKGVMGGERTSGAGCGYMDGGAAFKFTAVPMYLMIPNCSRLTRAGVNEIEGLSPELVIDWAALEPAQVAQTLDTLFAKGRR